MTRTCLRALGIVEVSKGPFTPNLNANVKKTLLKEWLLYLFSKEICPKMFTSKGIPTPSVKRQRQGERQIEYIGSMVMPGNGSGTDFGASP